MDGKTPQQAAEYDAKFAEYQDAMHAGAWRLGWSFFAVMVGLLPMMWVFVWLVGASGWEDTLFHAPRLMWLGVALNLGLIVFLIFRLYKKNLELDALKQRYLAELRALRGAAPARPRSADPDGFRDDLQPN